MLTSKPITSFPSSSGVNKIGHLLQQLTEGPQGLSVTLAGKRLGLKVAQAKSFLIQFRFAENLKQEQKPASLADQIPQLEQIELSSQSPQSDDIFSSGSQEISGSILKHRKSPCSSEKGHNYEPSLVKYKAAHTHASNITSPKSQESSIFLTPQSVHVPSEMENKSRDQEITPDLIKRNIVQSQAPLLRPKAVKPIPQARPLQPSSGVPQQKIQAPRLTELVKNSQNYQTTTSTYLQKLIQMSVHIQRNLTELTNRLLSEYIKFKVTPDMRNLRSLLILIVLRSHLVKALSEVSSQVAPLLQTRGNLSGSSQIFLRQ